MPGADAAAKAGTAVLQQMLTGATVTGEDVACATQDAADANGEMISVAATAVVRRRARDTRGWGVGSSEWGVVSGE